ncbi:MAG TPA: STT3 domain-containing protein [Pyrinomonadaceae bacterium]|jgi:4-amino-4-deoxy-L-arabinose transferase-like glycosyltransferase
MPRHACRYLLLAAALHVALAITIFLTGHFRVLPNTFDENGIALTFAIDGTTYQHVSVDLAEELKANGITAWLNAKAPLHSRLYSISFAIFGRLLGHNILAAESLNLFYYLAIIICIYFLGREVFDAQAGFIAAAIVALWPSFLFHSTQLIRDPLSIACLLSLMLLFVLVLNRTFASLQGLALGIAGALLATLFWLARGNMWNVIVVAVAITFVMLVLRMVREKRIMPGNVVVMVLIIGATLLVPTRLESTTLPGVRPPATPLAIPASSQPAAREGVVTAGLRQISTRRAGFRFYNARASDIDPEVQFSSTGEIVRFIPRALVIGFFAPFPRMWVQRGSFGIATRIFSGLETLAMYFLYVAAGFCVWQERRNRKMWLLFLVATIGMLALGLVVVNAGALFRLRYAFWILMIIIASRGFSQIKSNLRDLR